MTPTPKVLASFLSLLIVGCATPPPDAEPFSIAQVPAPAAEEVVLVVYREFSPPAMYKFTVQVDGSPKVELPTAAFAVIKTRPGPLDVGVVYPEMTLIKPTSAKYDFAPGTVHYLELVGDIGGVTLPGPLVRLWGNIVERPPQVATAQLGRCCRKVPVPLQ